VSRVVDLLASLASPWGGAWAIAVVSVARETELREDRRVDGCRRDDL